MWVGDWSRECGWGTGVGSVAGGLEYGVWVGGGGSNSENEVITYGGE